MSKFVYEILDFTEVEIYNTCGVYRSLEDALEVLRSLDSPIEKHGDWECFVYEIRKRELDKTNWADEGETLARFNLVDVYDEQKDENHWRLEEYSNV